METHDSSQTPLSALRGAKREVEGLSGIEGLEVLRDSLIHRSNEVKAGGPLCTPVPLLEGVSRLEDNRDSGDGERSAPIPACVEQMQLLADSSHMEGMATCLRWYSRHAASGSD